jgi:hypothetical protein
LYLATLKDKEIRSSYKLLPRKEGAADTNNINLVQILIVVEAVFRDMYALYSNTSPKQKITQQRANILNEFYTRASGKADGF